MVRDLVHNLCESLVVNIDGVAGVGKKTPPTPITYLTQWKIVGNSEVHGSEIWSCGEYNSTDGKYHILVQPQGGSIADIALTEPLRKVNSVADTIEFSNGVATLTRYFGIKDMGDLTYSMALTTNEKYRVVSTGLRGLAKVPESNDRNANILCAIYDTITANRSSSTIVIGMALSTSGAFLIYDENYNQSNSSTAFKAHVDGVELIYELATPTTELVDVPQIEEADNYTCVISQGAKAVEWSSFETE